MESVQLDTEKAFELIISFVDIAQKAGCFQLKEAALIHKAIVYLKGQGYQDEQNLSPSIAKNLVFQAVTLGQSKGAYNLDQAALLDRAISVYYAENVKEEASEETEDVIEEIVTDKKPLRVI